MKQIERAHRRGRRAAGRTAAALVIALVALAIIGVLLVLLARQSALERRALEQDVWRAQAGWLAESALDRAAERLAADPAYRGETWNLSADDLESGRAAVVVIEVEEIEGNVRGRRVVVRADYPDDPHKRVRETKQVVLEIEP
jgi:type II secretory pathway component PulK